MMDSDASITVETTVPAGSGMRNVTLVACSRTVANVSSTTTSLLSSSFSDFSTCSLDLDGASVGAGGSF